VDVTCPPRQDGEHPCALFLNRNGDLMAKKRKSDIIQLLATEYNLPLKEIELIVDSQFRLTAKTMSTQPGRKIRLPSLGSFEMNKKQMKKFNAQGKTTYTGE
jgi:nucleoid DNA-binding protein